MSSPNGARSSDSCSRSARSRRDLRPGSIVKMAAPSPRASTRVLSVMQAGPCSTTKAPSKISASASGPKRNFSGSGKSCRAAETYLRALLHQQTSGTGHWPGTFHLPGDHREPRRLHPGGEPTGAGGHLPCRAAGEGPMYTPPAGPSDRLSIRYNASGGMSASEPLYTNLMWTHLA